MIRLISTDEEDMEFIYDGDSDCELEEKLSWVIMQLSWWLENRGH